MNFIWLFFSMHGRMNRQDFWTGALSVILVLTLAFVAVRQSLGDVPGGQAILFVVEIALAYPFYCVMAKRFQDRGRSGLFALIAIGVPVAISLLSLAGLTGSDDSSNLLGQALAYLDDVIFFWIVIDLGIMPGTRGPNAFGPDPMDAA